MEDLTGRINGWQCDTCHEVAYCVHVHNGVTPMFLACRAEGVDPEEAKCKGTGKSLWYPSDPPPPHVIDAVQWEWYTPTPAELRVRSQGDREHVRKGGVLIRPLTDEGRRLLNAA